MAFILQFAVREQSPPQRDSQVHHNVIPRDGSERLLVVANQVGAKLLKEMEGPHKIRYSMLKMVDSMLNMMDFMLNVMDFVAGCQCRRCTIRSSS